MNENKTIFQNVWYTAKVEHRGKYVVSDILRKEEKSDINDLSFHPNQLVKEVIKPK